MAAGLSAADRRQIARLGVTEQEVRRQLELFRDPPPPARLVRPATVGDGIARLGEGPEGPGGSRREALLERHAAAAAAGRLSKMVPASGAASRMFRAPLAVLRGEGSEGDRRACERLHAEAGKLPFRAQLEAALGSRPEEVALEIFLGALLDGEKLGYAALPKALIPFHRDAGGARTPFDEHLAESAGYAADARRGRMHLTVGAGQLEHFEAHLERVRPALEASCGRCFEVGFSTQSHATDTVAVDLEGEPFRLADGSLLFRPGGHGALLWNLDALGGDVVFVKTVDNVVPEARRGPTLLWKRLLAGRLLELEERVFEVLRRLEEEAADDGWLDEALRFAAAELQVAGAGDLVGTGEGRRAFLARALHRPLRVCGMVVNTGEPGGGPFWVRGADGRESLQIVESSQIDLGDPEQQAIHAASTHFNPVDLVCGLRDHRGRPYELQRYTDPRAVFIARKSEEGRPLRALEHPGLWNGGMARWNTVFVEVPATTFAPVKTVFDLLRPEHQPG